MSALLVVQPSTALTPDQQAALTQAVQTLPPDWTVIVGAADTMTKDRFSVRVIGISFVTSSTFGPQALPEQLAAFLERARREHAPT